MNVTIAESLKAMWPETALGLLEYEVEVEASSDDLLDAFECKIVELGDQYTMDSIADNLHIESTRLAYKVLGKNPHEYRNAAEAMLRRVVKGSGLYHINNVVEVNNLISISSGYSIGSYDVAELQGDVELRRAEDGAHYDGIGKSSVNIGFLPVLHDDLGPFGNPSSDSQRAMIQKGKRTVMSVLYSFDGQEDLAYWMDQFEEELKKYCGVTEVKKTIV